MPLIKEYLLFICCRLTCPGYTDIIGGKFSFDAFWDSKILEDMTKLKEIAAVVLEILSRLEVVQNL